MDMQAPDVVWKEEIDKIERPDIEEKEIEIAEKLGISKTADEDYFC
jgi:hypothetical protein